MKVRHSLLYSFRFCMLLAILVFTAISLIGCSDTMDSIFGKPEEEKKLAPRTVEQIYNDAMDHLHAGWYETAAEHFDEVERQYPYSAWATKSQLMAAYSQYLKTIMTRP